MIECNGIRYCGLAGYGPEHAAALRSESGIRGISNGFLFVHRPRSGDGVVDGQSWTPGSRESEGGAVGDAVGDPGLRSKFERYGQAYAYMIEDLQGDVWDERRQPALHALRARIQIR